MLEIMCFVVTVILVAMFFGLFLRLALLVAGLLVIASTVQWVIGVAAAFDVAALGFVLVGLGISAAISAPYLVYLVWTRRKARNSESLEQKGEA